MGKTTPSPEDSYEALYRRWEEGSWSAAAISFEADAVQWREALTTKQRASALWNYAMFLTGVETVSEAIVAEVAAAPGYTSGILLSTQVADEARQHVFMDRFMREVAGQSSEADSLLRKAQDYIPWGLRRMLETLDESAEQLAREPQDRAVFAQTIALSHLVIAGVLAIPGQFFIMRWVDGQGILPGFSEGIANVARDEARHVAFGIKLLNDIIAASSECRAAVVRMLDRVIPYSVGVFVPPNRDHSYVECFDFTLKEIYAYGLRALEQRLASIGVEPSELFLLKRDDRSLTYEQRAERLLVLVETGVLGDGTPNLDDRALEILFEATARSIDIEVAHALGGPIEWRFDDASPWHLEVGNGVAKASRGPASGPALILESTAGDWARIAAGRADARKALLARRLRVRGSWDAVAKLPKLFT